MDIPKVSRHLARATVQTTPKTPEEMPRFMKSEVDKWIPAVNGMNITLQ